MPNPHRSTSAAIDVPLSLIAEQQAEEAGEESDSSDYDVPGLNDA